MRGMKFLLACIAMCVLGTASAQVTPLLRPFKDVPSTHPNYESILYLQANGIVQGQPDGSYWPESTINRAEFTKIIVASLAKPAVIETCLADRPVLFTDVSEDQWYAKYICIAKKFGMAYGNPDGSYRPAYAINFAEAATLIARNFNLEPQVPKPETLWYKPYIEALERQNAIPVSIKHFAQPVTRGEMAEIIYRVKAKIPPKPTQTYAALEELSKQPFVPKNPAPPSSAASSQASSPASSASSVTP